MGNKSGCVSHPLAMKASSIPTATRR